MTSRIVHFYFLRFRLIRREIRHFVFRIGSYETPRPQRHLFNKTVDTDRSAICLRVAANTRTKPTDRSAISLRVAAKTRTKPTGAPPIVKRTNMTLTMAADSIRYIRDLFARQTPTLPSWPICSSMDLMLIITPLEPNARTLSRPIPRHDAPGSLGGNGLERNRR